MLGKTVSDLQTSVEVGIDEITGTLNYITGYTGFSSNEAEQSGNFLALKMGTNLEESITTEELVGGTVGQPVTLDADMNIVLRISDIATQSIQVVTDNGAYSVTKDYSLSDLICKAASEA